MEERYEKTFIEKICGKKKVYKELKYKVQDFITEKITEKDENCT